MMGCTTIQVTQTESVATILLNRPEKRNALSSRLIDDLLAALDELADSPARVLVLTGVGASFCSGMDLKELRAVTSRQPEQNLADSRRVARLFRAIYDFPQPTIAAVNGPAVAGGCGMATLCDFTLASTEAKFGYPEVRIGFIPALVCGFLVRQIGDKPARDLLLTGRLVSAEEAYRLGLVTEVVAPEQLLPRAHERARALLENSPAALRATKRLLNAYARTALEEFLELAVDANAGIRATEDFHEGVSSFLEKRKPRWSA
jgi:methylglutaconyl-CoA hydratase